MHGGLQRGALQCAHGTLCATHAVKFHEGYGLPRAPPQHLELTEALVCGEQPLQLRLVYMVREAANKQGVAPSGVRSRRCMRISWLPAGHRPRRLHHHHWRHWGMQRGVHGWGGGRGGGRHHAKACIRSVIAYTFRIGKKRNVFFDFRNPKHWFRATIKEVATSIGNAESMARLDCACAAIASMLQDVAPDQGGRTTDIRLQR